MSPRLRFFLAPFCLFFLVGAASALAQPFSIQGSVTDYMTGNPIDLVHVSLHPHQLDPNGDLQAKTSDTITPANGQYRLGCPQGPFRLRYLHLAYTGSRGRVDPISVDEDPEKKSVRLIKKTTLFRIERDPQVAPQFAEVIDSRVREHDDIAAAFSMEWVDLTRNGVSPKAKYRICVPLAESNRQLAQIPTVAAFVAAGPEGIDRAVAIIDETVDQKRSFPSKGLFRDFGIKIPLALEVIGHAFVDPQVDMARKIEFAHQFNASNWSAEDRKTVAEQVGDFQL